MQTRLWRRKVSSLKEKFWGIVGAWVEDTCVPVTTSWASESLSSIWMVGTLKKIPPCHGKGRGLGSPTGLWKHPSWKTRAVNTCIEVRSRINSRETPNHQTSVFPRSEQQKSKKGPDYQRFLIMIIASAWEAWRSNRKHDSKEMEPTRGCSGLLTCL